MLGERRRGRKFETLRDPEVGICQGLTFSTIQISSLFILIKYVKPGFHNDISTSN